MLSQFVENFGLYAQFVSPHYEPWIPFLDAFTSGITQTFFAHRAWRVTNRNWFILVILMVSSGEVKRQLNSRLLSSHRLERHSRRPLSWPPGMVTCSKPAQFGHVSRRTLVSKLTPTAILMYVGN